MWSTEPGRAPFEYDDVSEQVAAALDTVEVDETLEGPATVRAYTVLYQGAEPDRAVAWCDAADGRRTLAVSRDAALLRTATEDELCGRPVRVHAGEFELS